MRYRTALHIDLAALAFNVAEIKRRCPSNEILFMAKSDAYGHGMIPMVRFAVLELGIKSFGLATIAEARVLREALPDLSFEAYVFSDTQYDLPELAQVYVGQRIIPVIADQAGLKFILGDPNLKHLPLCLKVNTGMNRLGFNAAEIDTVIKILQQAGRKSIYHLLSHFASSSSPALKEKTLQQYEVFQVMKKTLQAGGISIERTSIANSGAIEQGIALGETHIRPGLILYGPTSFAAEERHLTTWQGRNVSRLETNVIRAYVASPGLEVGYGQTPVPEEGTIIIVALGYGDGIGRRWEGVDLPQKILGHSAKVFGRVNMDVAQIFIPQATNLSLRPGLPITLWGHNPQDILSISDQLATIPYELTCQLTPRVPRIYTLG